MIPRLDLAFSYWIFAWYLLYIFKIIKYNPLCFLIIALIFDIIFVLVLIYYKNSTIYIFLTLFINLFIKVLPIWTLKNTTFNYDDLGAGVILFFIYIGWMKFNNKLNTNTFKSIFKSIKNKTPITPLLYFIDLSIFFKNK